MGYKRCLKLKRIANQFYFPYFSAPKIVIYIVFLFDHRELWPLENLSSGRMKAGIKSGRFAANRGKKADVYGKKAKCYSGVYLIINIMSEVITIQMTHMFSSWLLFFLILEGFYLANSLSEDVFGAKFDENRLVFFVESLLDLHILFIFPHLYKCLL